MNLCPSVDLTERKEAAGKTKGQQKKRVSGDTGPVEIRSGSKLTKQAQMMSD